MGHQNEILLAVAQGYPLVPCFLFQCRGISKRTGPIRTSLESIIYRTTQYLVLSFTKGMAEQGIKNALSGSYNSTVTMHDGHQNIAASDCRAYGLVLRRYCAATSYLHALA